MVEIRPQPGPQERFLATPADIAIYGGAAGGGKSWALLAEALRHVANPRFSGVIFRRTSPEIHNPGGMWDESIQLYPHLGGLPREHESDWSFPSGAYVKLGHLEHEGDLTGWQGAQIPLIAFDELTTFTERMFWFLMSRNRSTCGVRPYMRASCNPDATSWVARLIAWWIDEATGFAIPERSGAVRWFYRVNGVVQWFGSPAEAKAACPDQAAQAEPRSLTFVPADVHDNRILLEKNPEYLSALLALPRIEQERFLRGNWRITSDDGEWPASYFGPEIWVGEMPRVLTVRTIAVDPSKGRDAKHGDYSAIVSLGRTADGMLWVEADLARRPTPQIVADGLEIQGRFRADGFAVETNQFQELLADEFATQSRRLGIQVPLYRIANRVNKLVRIRRVGPLLKESGIRFVDTPGTRLLVQQLREFPQGRHDDGPDALEMAIRTMTELLLGVPDDDTPDQVRA